MPVGRVVILAGDHQWIARLVPHLHAASYAVRSAATWDEAAPLVTAFAPQVVVVHAGGAGSIPAELAAMRRALGIRLIVVSASTSPFDADALLPAGASSRDVAAAVLRLCTPPAPPAPAIERRAPSRPRRGDVRPCPRCGFAQRFEEPRAEAPAWLCRNADCLDAEFVRAP